MCNWTMTLGCCLSDCHIIYYSFSLHGCETIWGRFVGLNHSVKFGNPKIMKTKFIRISQLIYSQEFWIINRTFKMNLLKKNYRPKKDFTWKGLFRHLQASLRCVECRQIWEWFPVFWFEILKLIWIQVISFSNA